MAALWKSQLTSTATLFGNATLGDQAAVYELLCANFRAWRSINKVLAHAGVVVLQKPLQDITY